MELQVSSRALQAWAESVASTGHRAPPSAAGIKVAVQTCILLRLKSSKL